jgi:hypothetical protein
VHEPFQVRQRLGQRKRLPLAVEPVAEEPERHLVGAPWVASEHSRRLVDPAAVVRDDLVCPDDGVVVTGQRERRRELDRAVERGEVVSERIEP